MAYPVRGDIANFHGSKKVDSTSVQFKVNAISSADGNRLTSELQALLLERAPSLSIHRKKEREDTQDAGTILVAVLAAPAIIELSKGALLELAKGVADWIRKRRVNLIINETSISIENAKAEDIERLLHEGLKARKAM
jgi:hypothetical protein